MRRITGDHRRGGCIGILNAKSVRKNTTIYARCISIQFCYLRITHFNVDNYPTIDIQSTSGLFYTILHVAKAKKAKTTFARRNGYIIYNSKSCSLNNPILNLFFKNY